MELVPCKPYCRYTTDGHRKSATTEGGKAEDVGRQIIVGWGADNVLVDGGWKEKRKQEKL